MKTLITPNEYWKDIPGYEGKYQASTAGRIRSLSYQVPCAHNGTRTVKGRILQPGQCADKRLRVVLTRGTPSRLVHRLIMLTFVGPCPEGKEVLHINGDPTDNRLSNLRYGTRSENILDVYKIGGRWRKLSAQDVQEIRRRLEQGESGRSIARAFKVSDATISNIKVGRTYTWLKF